MPAGRCQLVGAQGGKHGVVHQHVSVLESEKGPEYEALMT